MIAVAEEEEALVRAQGLHAVEAGERRVGPEVPIDLPDPVRVRRSDLADEGNDGAFKMERHLHVEVSHPVQNGDQARQTTSPLPPGGSVLVLEENG